jgi:hypothetical protein
MPLIDRSMEVEPSQVVLLEACEADLAATRDQWIIDEA